MENFGLMLVYIGAIVLLVGVVWIFGGRFIPFGKLPGDFSFSSENGNFKFYFPLGSSIVISIILSLGFLLFKYFRS